MWNRLLYKNSLTQSSVTQLPHIYQNLIVNDSLGSSLVSWARIITFSASSWIPRVLRRVCFFVWLAAWEMIMTAKNYYYCFFLIKVNFYSSVPRRYWQNEITMQNEITKGLRPYKEATENLCVILYLLHNSLYTRIEMILNYLAGFSL